MTATAETEEREIPNAALKLVHGYPWLIHRLTYRRTHHHNLRVRGYNWIREHGEDLPEIRDWTWR